jgi:hypothetical protein
LAAKVAAEISGLLTLSQLRDPLGGHSSLVDRARKQQLPWWADRDIVFPGQIAADTSETGTKATRGHF